MDDRFMHGLKAAPDPGFGRRLRERLRAMEPVAAEREPRGFRWAALIAPAVLVAMLVSVILFPSVRASAQAFLDLFRVRNFTAVGFDASRMERLRALDQNNDLLVFDLQETRDDPYLPSDVPSRQAAEAQVGIPVLEPTYLPDGLVRQKLQTAEERHARLGASTARLRAVLDGLDLKDVEVPPGLDGQSADVHLYPMALQRWGNERRHVELIQARSPEVKLPPGVDLARLGEMGLRILGLDAGRAHSIAQSVDWSSTLVVPVPMNASAFREVSVRGNRGLLVTTTGMPKENGGRSREGALLLWTEGERVFALSGDIASEALMQMAESLR